MRPDLVRLCRSAGLEVSGDTINVRFEDDRRHRVQVHDTGEALRLVAVVARPAVVQALDSPALLAWRRNRSVQLVGFRLDDRGRLVGESWVPRAGLTGEEFAFHVRRVAAECDRLEYLLTGRDVE